MLQDAEAARGYLGLYSVFGGMVNKLCLLTTEFPHNVGKSD